MSRREKIILGIIVAVAAFSLAAYTPSRYYISGIFTYWTKTDTSLAVNFDSANATARAYIIRLADSAAVNRLGTARGEAHIRLWANFGNGANDSTNCYINVNGIYHSYPLPYNMYADRFILITNEPNGRGPSTFRDDLPRVSTDSCLIFRVARNASRTSGSRASMTIYKVARNAGLSFANTVGVFYDMVIFDEAVFGTTGVSRSVLITLSLKKDR